VHFFPKKVDDLF